MCCRQRKNTTAVPETLPPLPTAHRNYLNICVLGESGVGKTCLLRRFLGRPFSLNIPITVLDLEFKTIVLPNGERFQARLWDTAGQERYHAISLQTVRQSHGAVLVYDESTASSLAQLIDYWFPLIKQNCPQLRYLLVVGNKNDILATAETIDQLGADINRLSDLVSKHCKTSFVSVSARTMDTRSCEAVLEHFCERILRDIKETEPGHYKDFLLVG